MLKYCKICNSETEHTRGNHKSQEIEGELFFIDVSLNEALKAFSNGYKELSEQSNQNGFVPMPDYLQSDQGKKAAKNFFANVIRSLKCEKCGHLIRLNRLP